MINTKQMHDIMSRRKKMSNETYYQYMLVMKYIAISKRAKLPAYVAIQYIVEGISDYESNKLLFYGVISYSALKEKLSLYKAFKQKPKMAGSSRQRDLVKNMMEEPAKLSQRSYKSGERDHMANMCTEGVKCFRCNEFGHIGVRTKSRLRVRRTRPKLVIIQVHSVDQFIPQFGQPQCQNVLNVMTARVPAIQGLIGPSTGVVFEKKKITIRYTTLLSPRTIRYYEENVQLYSNCD